MRHLAFSLLVVIVAALPARAQEDDGRIPRNTNGLIVEVCAGWDNIVDRSLPVPISFLLTNSTDALIEGTVHLTSALDGKDVYLGEVTLGPQGIRRFATIRKLVPRAPGRRARADDGWQEVFAESRSGDKVLWRREIATSSANGFSTNQNFVLLVDDSGRRLIAGSNKEKTAGDLVSDAVSQRSTAALTGRPVASLNMKTWQIPDHPAPLACVQAIVFPEASPAKNINKAQWRSIAEWVCEGGTVFVHAGSDDVISALTTASPLSFELAEANESRPVRRIGLGQILEYEDNLFSSAGAATRQRISEQVALLEGSTIRDLVDGIRVNNPDYQTRAQLNRVYVASLFGFYTLFIGFFALFLFRLSKRKVMIYTVFVVAAASISAGVLGGILRVSQGDLKWGSVTYAGAGGFVQLARINIQSSGGSNEDVAVKGERPDLQFTGISETRSYYNSGYGYSDEWRSRTDNPPFDYQVNQFGSSVDDAFKVKIRMTPWGRRRLHATGYKRGAAGLDLKLEYTPKGSSTPNVGSFRLTMKNPGGLRLKGCELVIDVTQYRENEQQTLNQNSDWGYDQFGNYAYIQSRELADNLVQMRQTANLDLPGKGKSKVKEFPATFRRSNDENFAEAGYYATPQLDRIGTTRAWVVGVLAQSPSLRIDRANTEFLPHNELHVFIQEISPENLPDVTELVGGPEDALDPDRIRREHAKTRAAWDAADQAAREERAGNMGGQITPSGMAGDNVSPRESVDEDMKVAAPADPAETQADGNAEPDGKNTPDSKPVDDKTSESKTETKPSKDPAQTGADEAPGKEEGKSSKGDEKSGTEDDAAGDGSG